MELISSGITAEPLMFKELKSLTSYLNKTKLVDKKIIYNNIIKDNLFQYKSPNSTSRRFNVIFKRYLSLSEKERDVILTGSFWDASLIALYSVYKTNILFKEFFDNVIKNKLKNKDFNFSSKDIYIFFGEIGIKYNNVLNWTDSTRKKIVEVITKILQESLLLSKNKILQKNPISNLVKQSIAPGSGCSFLDIIESK